ncbi:MAG: sulfatase-like hydrolase/transferase [Candidatus Latescibacteria bacterium]|nr:sulfatase-like hydrolase/transferase [Candidatus Latescibacterota bacterium]
MNSYPNILLLMTDQQRWDAMGCSGGWIETPHMDRIAAEGMRFTQCVTTSPVCISARTSMATGLYPHHTGVWNNMEYTLPPETLTWMQTIREAGYRTSLFGKTHLHPHKGDLRDREHLMHGYGLDDVDEIGGPRASTRVLSHMTAAWQDHGLWEAYQQDFKDRFANRPHMVRPSSLPLAWYADVYVGQQASRYLKNYDRQEPWFCWVSFGGPHEPWDTPAAYANRYDPGKMPAPASRPEGRSDRPRGTIDQRFEQAPQLDPGDVGAMRADYAGNVTLIDDQIGHILSVIEQRGELDNTVIVLTSDHGEHNGDAGLIYKETFLDGAVRVPLLIRTPDSGLAGSVSNTMVEWFDVGPTLVDLAGGEITHAQDARSLGPVLGDLEQPHREESISEYRQECMMMTPEWKIAINAEQEVYLLFDRSHDPYELKNLAGHPEYTDIEKTCLHRLQERL